MRFKSIFIAVAVFAGLAAALRLYAAGPATGLTITPSSATITADQTQTFIVKTTHADGTSTDVTSAATLSIDDPLGSISGATYSAGKVGTWNIQASYQSFNVTATVTVTVGALAEIDVNPNSDPEYTTIGKNRTFIADGFDLDKNQISDPSVVWSVIGEIGTINAAGVFTPTTVGTGKVQAQSGTITDQVAVVVSEAPPVNANTNTASTTTNTTTVVSNANASDANVNAAPPAENGNVNTPVITITEDSVNASEQCSTRNSWLWILLLVVTLVAIFFLYSKVPATKLWPVIVALLSAGILTFVQRKYGCGAQDWWAWIMIIGTVAISLVAVRQSNTKKPLA